MCSRSLHDCIYVSSPIPMDIFASGKCVNHEFECVQEVPDELHFYEPEKAIELPQK